MLKYISSQGDTWDLIAFNHYGLTQKEFMMSSLLDANPDYVKLVILPANLEINIPDAVIPDTINLPPWLR